MKKMMMFLAVILAAGMMQAAQVSWAFTKGSAALNGLSLYSLVTVPETIGAITDITDAANGTAIITKQGRAGYGAKGSITGIADETSSLDFYFFITANVDGMDYYWKSTVLTGTPYTPPASGVELMFDASKITAPGGAGWTAVPEPTSMALLLLGAAVFGLRRKVRG